MVGFNLVFFLLLWWLEENMLVIFDVVFVCNGVIVDVGYVMCFGENVIFD